MSEINEFLQPSALSWRPEVSGTWLAYESQDTQRANAAAAKPAQPKIQPIIDVMTSRPGESLSFGKDNKGYYFYKASGEDKYALNYFDKAKKWARLETIDTSGRRVISAEYDLDLQRKNVDQWWAKQHPAEVPQQPASTHLDITPAFPSTEKQNLVGRPLLPDNYHYLSDLIDSTDISTKGSPLSVLRMYSGLADTTGNTLEKSSDGLEAYIQGTRNSDPMLRLKLAYLKAASASRYILGRDENGELVFRVSDESKAGQRVNEAIKELDTAIQATEVRGGNNDYGRVNFQARSLKNNLIFMKSMIPIFQTLDGRPVPEFIPMSKILP